MGRILEAFKQFFDDEGQPVVNGWLSFLESGSNNTLKDTFYDYNYQTKNPNPVQLDGSGRCPNVFGQGNYRIISFLNDPEEEDSPGEQLQVFDPVTAQADGTGSGGGSGFQSWSSATIYQINDIVIDSGIYYRSMIIDNVNNNPPLSAFAWERIEFIYRWNSTKTYSTDDFIRYEGALYFSKTNSNTNNQPDESPSHWKKLSADIESTFLKSADYTIINSEIESLFVLSGSASADATFTLPVVGAENDRTRLWFYNASDYNLVISPPFGGPDIWLSGSITMSKGTMIGIYFCYDLNQWLPESNNGPVLGGQDIGTSANNVNTAYLGIVNVSGALNVPSDVHVYFGDSNQIDIFYDSTTPEFSLSVTGPVDLAATGTASISCVGNMSALCTDVMTLTSTNDMIFATTAGDFEFSVNGINQWVLLSSGELVPGSSNTLPWLGNLSSEIQRAYIDDVYSNTMNIDAAGRVYLGDSAILYFGSGNDMGIQHTGSQCYLDNTVGNFIIRTGSPLGDAFYITQGKNCYFKAGVYLDASEVIGFGSSFESTLYYSDISDGFNIKQSNASPIRFHTNNLLRWSIEDNGDLMPSSDGTLDIGGYSVRLGYVYADHGYINTLHTNTIRTDGENGLYFTINDGVGYTYFTIKESYLDGSGLNIEFTYDGATRYKLVIPPA